MSATQGERRSCEKCGVEIAFLRHDKTGRLAPIEVAPIESGKFEVDWVDHTYRTFYGLKQKHVPYYTNHYASCPEAQFFRAAGAG